MKFEVYDSDMQLQIGVKVIIENQGSYLFIKRSSLLQNEREPSWDIPGGRIEPTESLQQALQREVSEELGIELTVTPTLINAQDIFVEAKQLHVVRLTYLVSQDIQAITLSDEHQEHIWASLPDTTTMNIEPYLRQTLQLLA